MKHKNKLIFAVFIALLVVLYFQLDFDVSDFMSLVQQKVEQNYFTAAVCFFFIYVLVAALNLPGTGMLTIGAGVAFGLLPGLLLVSFSSSLGATLGMIISRTLLRDWVQRRFSGFAAAVNRGMDADGATYLFTLRLIPIVPFFVINPVFGLTRMPVWQFYLVSQLGMLPATAIYVNLGATVGSLEQLSIWSVFTADVLIAFGVLLAFPFIAKRVIKFIRQRYTLRMYKKPKKFDANLIVIGAGAAGLVSSYIAATLRAKVFLIEKNRMGGDCLNTGCVPSKALIRSAKAVHQVKDAARFGVHTEPPKVDFKAVMQRVQDVIAEVEPHDSIERYTKLGVDCISGDAEILSPYEVRVGDQTLSAKKIIIAAGARPRIPPISGLSDMPFRTSEDIWSLETQPKKLLVLGGGPIGCELAQAFARLGSHVTLIERSAHLVPKADPEIGTFIAQRFLEEGIDVKTDTEVSNFERDENNVCIAHTTYAKTDQEIIYFDLILVALGRVANTDQGLLSRLPFTTNESGTLRVDKTMQTSVPGIYACGDIAGPYQLTHAASHQAWYACVNALLGNIKSFKINYETLPWVIYSDPEIAHVGYSERYLKEKGVAHDVTCYDLADLDRAIADSEREGLVKVMTKKNTDKILGATIVASRAGEMIQIFTYAKKHRKGLNSIMGTIHSYPSYAEAAKYAAGQWKANRKPENLLNIVAWWFRFLRR